MSAGASATVRLAVLVALWTAITPGPAIANDLSSPPRPTPQSVRPDFTGHAQLVLRDPSGRIATVAPPRSGPYDPSGLSAGKAAAALRAQQAAQSPEPPPTRANFVSVNLAAPLGTPPPEPPRNVPSDPAIGTFAQWDGIAASDEGSTIDPPDANGAAGPSAYVEIVSSMLVVYDRTTKALLASMTLDSFTGENARIVYPQIQYDPVSSRWFYSGFTARSASDNRIAFGFSKATDPTDLRNGWCPYDISTGADAYTFPRMGHDDNWILIGANVLSAGTFATATILALPKPAAGTITACPTRAPFFQFGTAANPLVNADHSKTFSPVATNTISPGTGYIVSAHVPTGTPTPTASAIMFWHLSSSSPPILTADGDSAVIPYGYPANAAQFGSTNLIDTGDARLTQASAVRDPSQAGNPMVVYLLHTVSDPGNPSAGGAIVRWWKILPGVSWIWGGDVGAGSSGFGWNGAIAPALSGYDFGVIANTGGSGLGLALGESMFSGFSFSIRFLATSTAPDTDFTCSPGPCSWGHYAGVSADPLLAHSIWGTGMTVGPPPAGTQLAQWTTTNFTDSSVRLQGVLPALANHAYGGGYTTTSYIENTAGYVPSAVMLRYFDTAGNPVGTGDSIENLPSEATFVVNQSNGNSIPAGTAGSALIYSNQPIVGMVNETGPLDGSSYDFVGALFSKFTLAYTLFAPAIASDAYGGYTTGIGLMNAGAVASTVTITYRTASGATQKIQTLNIPAHAYQGIYSGSSGNSSDANLPAGFAGTATISTTTGALAAIVNEVGPGGQFSSYNALQGGASTLFAPTVLNGAYGGYVTGIGIQETSGNAGTLTVTYHDTSGQLTKTVTKPLPANGYLGIYQGDPADGPPASPNGYTATLQLTSTGGPAAMAAVVNEVAPGAKLSTSYDAGGSAFTGWLPLVENNGPDGVSTGLGIMNTGTTAETLSIQYYDATTGVAIGPPHIITALAPGAFVGVYQPDAGLPPGIRATAYVNATSVTFICNEVGPGTFMSY